MGSRVSVHRDSDESTLKLHLGFASKTDKVVTPSPPKDKPMLADHLKSRWSPPPPVVTASRDFGSKEESFFDSHPWLDSDCEDDFYSVNGDFTPSRGNTPVHHSFSAGNMQTNRTSNSTLEPSPTDKKKKLSELFKDTVGDEQDAAGNHNGATRKLATKTSTLEVPPKSGNSAHGAKAVSSRERSANGDFMVPVQKSGKSAQCCLPRLRSFTERKNRTSPARCFG